MTLNNLPEGWAIAKIKDVASHTKGKKPKNLSKCSGKGFVPYIDIKAFENGEVRQFADETSSNITSENDVLVVWDGARSGLPGIGKKGAIGSTIMALHPIEISTYFLFSFMQSKFEYINSNPRGTGIPHVDPTIFWDLDFPIAPFSEQQRIVAKLEKLMAKLDQCKARLEKIPFILKRFRQSVLAAACSGELTKDWREKSIVSMSVLTTLEKIKKYRIEQAKSKRELNQILKYYDERDKVLLSQGNNGSIPYNWASCQIGDIGNVFNGSTPSRKISEYWDGNISWVSSGEVRNSVIDQTKEKITDLGYKNSSVRMIPEGSVLIAMIGEGKTRGQSSILKTPATINQNIAAVFIDHGRVISEYLWYWFQYQYEANRQVGSGSGPQALNCQRVRGLPFNFPPLEEQKEIVLRIESIFKFAVQIEGRYEKAKVHVDKLTQSILAKAFRGELVPQDPNDPPASDLLERIKATREKAESNKKNRKKSSKTRGNTSKASQVKNGKTV